jgi:hypothetical protein
MADFARVRAESVTGYAALWLRADDARGQVLGFDSLQGRAPIVGTHPFTDHQVAIDVPEGAARILFGYLLHGSGAIEATAVGFEVVAEEP